MIIRKETAADIEAITKVTIAAFKTLAISNHTEQFIISALRAADALTISLVAEIDGQVVGHIAFSPVTISDGSCDWYALGPISIQPKLHRQGIGQALVREGLVRLKALGALGCVLVGEPSYYNRFGFKSFSNLSMEGVPQEYVLALPFSERMASGVITHHHAFSVKN